jgi:8-oxo-dGTP pyrophosphatase MutT (NUDIX family)
MILDATILQAVGRELWEETGLRLRSVRRLVDEVQFRDDHYPGFIWRNMTFVVDLDDAAMRTGTAATGQTKDKDDTGYAELSIPVKLDPQEHQDWGWATEAEIMNQSWQKGAMELFTTQKQLMLQAFAQEHKIN